jgi:hypothetical protein
VETSIDFNLNLFIEFFDHWHQLLVFLVVPVQAALDRMEFFAIFLDMSI